VYVINRIASRKVLEDILADEHVQEDKHGDVKQRKHNEYSSVSTILMAQVNN
jgi:hypothetical protein